MPPVPALTGGEGGRWRGGEEEVALAGKKGRQHLGFHHHQLKLDFLLRGARLEEVMVEVCVRMVMVLEGRTEGKVVNEELPLSLVLRQKPGCARG